MYKREEMPLISEKEKEDFRVNKPVVGFFHLLVVASIFDHDSRLVSRSGTNQFRKFLAQKPYGVKPGDSSHAAVRLTEPLTEALGIHNAEFRASRKKY